MYFRVRASAPVRMLLSQSIPFNQYKLLFLFMFAKELSLALILCFDYFFHTNKN